MAIITEAAVWAFPDAAAVCNYETKSYNNEDKYLNQLTCCFTNSLGTNKRELAALPEAAEIKYRRGRTLFARAPVSKSYLFIYGFMPIK